MRLADHCMTYGLVSHAANEALKVASELMDMAYVAIDESTIEGGERALRFRSLAMKMATLARVCERRARTADIIG